MELGDLLYLPRGFVHDARAREVFSAHVTVGVTAELFSELIAAIVRLPDFLKALPPGFSSADFPRETFKAEFAQRLDQLRTKADLDHVIDSFLEKTRAGAITIPEPTAFRADVRLPDG